jgi:hypothetical protein
VPICLLACWLPVCPTYVVLLRYFYLQRFARELGVVSSGFTRREGAQRMAAICWAARDRKDVADEELG